MASVGLPLTRGNQDMNSIGHLPLLQSVHTATYALCGMKVFQVSYGLWSPRSTTWSLDPQASRTELKQHYAH